MPPELPKKLYKYQPLSVLSLANLKQRQLFFPSVTRFNDPFDCRYPNHLRDLTPEELGKLIDIYEHERGLDVSDYRDQLNSDPAGLARSLSKNVPAILESAVGSRGVCCFSARMDSLLMWGHYADGHRGFCLEFDTATEPFSRAIPVVYREEFPLMAPAEAVVSGDFGNIFDIAHRTKSVDWKYEQEWRLLHANSDQAFTYAPASLTGVYFGMEMPFVHQELLALVVRGSSTKLFQMQRRANFYAVEAKSVEYIPHPQAGGSGG